ncbi:MAG: radical SAM protein [Planctomycetota bacterium]
MNWFEDCRICPRNCGADRTRSPGFCGAPADLVVASAGPHFGEESPLVGAGGSGTIFLAGCNLRCVFCQNYDISHDVRGETHSPDALARLMLSLQAGGCENINFVTPSHYTPALAEAVRAARSAGLAVPIVWNCGGYEKVETLRALAGLVEIYMPDLKFLDAQASRLYLHAADYPDRAREAIREMHRQVGDLEIRRGLAVRGLLVRHLVMPGFGGDTKAVLNFLADEISPKTYVNVMDQYRPCGEAARFPQLAVRPSRRQIAEARAYALEKGLRLDKD